MGPGNFEETRRGQGDGGPGKKDPMEATPTMTGRRRRIALGLGETHARALAETMGPGLTIKPLGRIIGGRFDWRGVYRPGRRP